ncbi:multidrug transporter [Dyadobacter sp. 676]|uniref:Multidrug transporter n=1 Tax=Dyadobacter sp. 676 TaxID=3088362 RepID=A0AAU8FLQ2_9BACT
MSSQVTKIAKNTLFLYVRMFLLMFIGLYTSRVVLEVLGVEDLGIYNVVGSVVMMLEFVSSSLTNSSQRYLNIGLGKNDLALTNRYFSQSVGLHFLLSLFIVLLLETVGLWMFNNKLVIPADRREAAFWVYQLSTLAAFIKINQICFQSVVVARESMSVYAYLSIFEGVAKLGIVYLIGANAPFDKLAYYGFLLVVIQLVVFLTHMVYCYRKYPESHYKFFWDNALFKEMAGFVSVNAFGYISWAIGVQGINVVLNLFFGPTVNAARGLASTAGRFINQFVNNIYLAIKPQIIQSYAKGETESMVMLAEKSTVYVFYLVLFVSLPILFETSFILQFWLKEVPEYTKLFTELTLIQSYFWMLPIPYSQIATATGRIRNIQLYGRIFTLLALPVSYAILLVVRNPYYPVFVIITMDAFFWLYTIYDVDKQLNIKFDRYVRNVILPVLYMAAAMVISLSLGHYMIAAMEPMFRFIIEVAMSLSLGFLFYFFIRYAAR